MTEIGYGEALSAENRLLGNVCRGADWSTPVPTCPGWTLLQVIRHVGRGDRWAAQIIREGTGEVDPRQVPGGRPPDDEAGAIEWLQAGPGALLDAVEKVGADTPAWTFVGPRPAAWWIRRRLHEATVHRADVALAIGRSYDIDPWLAADGISEWLSLIGILAASDTGEPVRLEATDADLPVNEWLFGSGAPAATLRGRAADLLLALSGRENPPSAGVSVSGDEDAWDRARSRMAF